MPEWFSSLCENHTNFLVEFKKFFVEEKQGKYLDELFLLLGTLHIQNVQTYLPEESRSRLIKKVQERDNRFITLWKHKLSQGDNIESLYRSSAFSGKAPKEIFLGELTSYFFSRGMPLHECKTFGFYTYEPLKKNVDAWFIILDNLLKSLFKLESKQPLKNLTLEEKCLLFRTVALITPSRKYSWEEILCEWFKNDGQQIPEDLVLYQISSKNEAMQIPYQEKALNFHQFVVSSTLYALFKAINAPLPYVKQIGKNLASTWLSVESDLLRQNVIYFLDRLLIWHKNKQLKFPFEDACKLLKDHFGDKSTNTVVYDFLHAVIHYFTALSRLTVTDGVGKEFLFKAIYAVPYKERKIFDNEIIEKFSRSSFVVDEKYVCFANQHKLSLDIWGKILLRFSRTKVKLSKTGENSYDLADHLKVVDKIEEILGIPFPENALEDFLFFQVAKNDVFTVLDQFQKLRSKIHCKYLDTLSIPDNDIQEWVELSSLFVDSFVTIDLKLKDESESYANRIGLFPMTIFALASIIQMATYPKLLVSFARFIPLSIKKNAEGKVVGCVFEEKGSAKMGCLQLLHDNFSPGPMWRADWNVRNSCLTISIINTSNVFRTATFSLKAPPQALLDLTLLRSLVDGLGKEMLSEDEEVEKRKKEEKGLISIGRKYSSSLPEDISLDNEKFDWHLKNSPLVESVFSQSSVKQIQKQETRAELFKFVCSLHSLFKKSFYTVLLENRMRALYEPDILHLIPYEESFYLKNVPPRQCQEIDILRGADYKNQLIQIYEKKRANLEKTILIEKAFRIKIGTEKITEAFVSIKIEPEEEASCVTWFLHTENQVYDLRVKYPFFKDQEEFVRAMVWHLAFLKQHFLRESSLPVD